MRPKAIFAVKALVISVVLFAVWSFFSSAYLFSLNASAGYVRNGLGLAKTVASTDKSSYCLIPAFAMILVAQASIKRKIAFLAGATAVLYLIDILILATGLKAIAEGGGRLASDSWVASANIFYHSYGWLVPLVAVFLFIGGIPDRLWEKQAHDKRRLKPPKAVRVKR